MGKLRGRPQGIGALGLCRRRFLSGLAMSFEWGKFMLTVVRHRRRNRALKQGLSANGKIRKLCMWTGLALTWRRRLLGADRAGYLAHHIMVATSFDIMSE